MVNRRLFTTAALLGSLGFGGAAAWAQGASTQSSPQATEPLPAQGAGQEAFGAAVQGSAPGPNAPSSIDKSQEQGGKLLKQGEGASDMGAAAGAGAAPAKKP